MQHDSRHQNLEYIPRYNHHQNHNFSNHHQNNYSYQQQPPVEPMDIDSSTIFRRPTRQGYNKNQQQPTFNPFRQAIQTVGNQFKRYRDETVTNTHNKAQRVNQLNNERSESNEESINVTIGEDEQKLLHDKAPDEKEKCTDAEGDTTAKNSAQKSTKTIAALDDTRTSKDGSSSSKCSKSDDDKSKRKDEKSGDKKDKDISEQKSSSNKSSQKDDKEKSSVNISTKSSTGKQTTPSRNLWISGLSSLTRARDLKTIFSKYGKVIGAKVVTNTRTPGTRCYDYVTMSSSSDASRRIENLHHTELHGRIISVELTKNEISNKCRQNTSG
ncbi:SAFB-like transcription modulator [Bactrocera dorsalis]|uniref:SAFB-like transcription modulator n=1 Tax=Bactrocera dorsalis TaxID=27457 RepID=A0ABM3K2P4_BACDO|nr:SAFB-like transcription modulator [Bactrocera dorsalis]